MKKQKEIAQPQEEKQGPTFFEVFQNAINEHEASNPKNHVLSDNQPFTLYEDLKLLLELSKNSQMELKQFEKISQLLNRTKSTLKRRYQEFLKNISQSDLEHIFNFVQRHGLSGYLIFKVESGNWKLSEIESVQTRNNQTPQITPMKSIVKPSQLPISQSASKIEPQFQKKIKLNQFQLSAKSSKYDQSNKKALYLKSEKGQLTVEEKKEAEQLKYNLKLFSDWLKVPYQDVVQRLYQCSGDLNKLLTVYIDAKEYSLWTKEADEALVAYFYEKNELEKLKLKAVLRNDEENVKRRQWLSI